MFIRYFSDLLRAFFNDCSVKIDSANVSDLHDDSNETDTLLLCVRKKYLTVPPMFALPILLAGYMDGIYNNAGDRRSDNLATK